MAARKFLEGRDDFSNSVKVKDRSEQGFQINVVLSDSMFQLHNYRQRLKTINAQKNQLSNHVCIRDVRSAICKFALSIEHSDLAIPRTRVDRFFRKSHGAIDPGELCVERHYCAAVFVIPAPRAVSADISMNVRCYLRRPIHRLIAHGARPAASQRNGIIYRATMRL